MKDIAHKTATAYIAGKTRTIYYFFGTIRVSSFVFRLCSVLTKKNTKDISYLALDLQTWMYSCTLKQFGPAFPFPFLSLRVQCPSNPSSPSLFCRDKSAQISAAALSSLSISITLPVYFSFQGNGFREEEEGADRRGGGGGERDRESIVEKANYVSGKRETCQKNSTNSHHIFLLFRVSEYCLRWKLLGKLRNTYSYAGVKNKHQTKTGKNRSEFIRGAEVAR